MGQGDEDCIFVYYHSRHLRAVRHCINKSGISFRIVGPCMYSYFVRLVGIVENRKTVFLQLRGNYQGKIKMKTISGAIANDRPFTMRSGVLDFIYKSTDYLENYELICKDDLVREKTPTEVKKAIFSLVKDRKLGRFCDIGCGDGFIIKQAESPDKIAVDIALDYLRILPDTITRVRCWAEDTPFKTGSMDTILCSDVIEHVLDARLLAGELTRIVKPEGSILLAFPFEQDLSVYELPAYKAKYAKYKYVHLRTINDLLIKELFPNHDVIFSRVITEGMKLMEFKPYPIKFIELKRKVSRDSLCAE